MVRRPGGVEQKSPKDGEPMSTTFENSGEAVYVSYQGKTNRAFADRQVGIAHSIEVS